MFVFVMPVLPSSKTKLRCPANNALLHLLVGDALEENAPVALEAVLVEVAEDGNPVLTLAEDVGLNDRIDAVASTNAAVVAHNFLELVELVRLPVQAQHDLAVQALVALASLQRHAAGFAILVDEAVDGVAPGGEDVLRPTRDRHRNLQHGERAAESDGVDRR